MIRLLILKLVNTIDVNRQLPIFETLHKELIVKDQDNLQFEMRASIALRIYQDSLKLKLGRRISHPTVIQIFDTLNSIMTKKNVEKVK